MIETTFIVGRSDKPCDRLTFSNKETNEDIDHKVARCQWWDGISYTIKIEWEINE